jgi:hypothetical protein
MKINSRRTVGEGVLFTPFLYVKNHLPGGYVAPVLMNRIMSNDCILSRKNCTRVSCLTANEKAVLKSRDSRGQKGLIEEQEQRKTKGEWLHGDIAQPNEQNLKERFM